MLFHFPLAISIEQRFFPYIFKRAICVSYYYALNTENFTYYEILNMKPYMCTLICSASTYMQLHVHVTEHAHSTCVQCVS